MKKLISLMLAMLLLVGVLAGCGEKTAEPVETPVVENPAAETEKEETADVEETPAEETPEPRVVIDALGREVEVPYEVDAKNQSLTENNKGDSLPKYAIVNDRITNYAYYGDQELYSYSIPDVITNIGDFAFSRTKCTYGIYAGATKLAAIAV